jgi:putative ABC transport system permease protein
MKVLRRFAKRLAASVLRRGDDDRLREELAEHLTLLTEEYARAGLPLDEARRRARLTLGTQDATIEAWRDEQRLRLLDDTGQDLRYAARTLRKQPTFTLAATLTLALGIGAYTAIFSLVNSIVLKPLPYPRAEELVSLQHTAPGAAGMGNLASDLRLSASMYFTYAEHTRTFSSIGVWTAGKATVTGAGSPEEVRSIFVSDGVFQALGVLPLLGRALGAADQEPGAPARPVLLGYGFWMRRFGGDASIIGRTIVVNSSPREIVGVMPKDFRIVTAEPDLIAPVAFNRSTLKLPGFGLETVARLKPGVTIAEATADVARMVPIWMRSWPMVAGVDASIYETWQITPVIRPLAAEVVGNVARVLWVLFGALGIVLLVACANVAALMLVRMEGRQSELAVRAALGAGRGRIVRALLVESALLAFAGGALGVGLATVSIQLLVSHGPDTLPRLHEIAVDSRALGFAIIASLISSVVFGVLPAFRYTRPQIAGTLQAGGRAASDSRERRTARHVLVVVQIASALVLLVASGLMIRTFQALHAVEPGFMKPEEIQTIDVAIPMSLVQGPERAARLQQDIADRLSTLAGVTSIGFTSVVPMVGGTPDWDVVFIEGRHYASQEIPPMRFFKKISPQYLATMGTRLAAGRDLTWTDLYERRRVVLVSENMARESWGSAAAAIGKRFQVLPGRPWQEVVGVVQDVHEHGADLPAPAIVYWPTFGENPYREGEAAIERNVTFTVRSPQAGRETLLASVRRAVWSANASLSVANERTMQQIYDRSMERASFTLVLLALAGVMTLALGVIGIYGAIAYAAAQQMREIGIRVALGAPPGAVTGMFMRRSAVLTGVGVIVGLVSAIALTRVMSSLLFGIGPLDPLTYVAVSLILIAAAAAASYIPARKASAVDPVKALRAQ